MALEIVKVQIPLAGDRRIGLVYDKARKHMIEQPILEDTRKALKGDLKGYFRAAWSSVVGWGISERVPDQDW